MRTGIIILARMGATRLPGKVLKKVCGITILEHIIYRLKKVKGVDELIVATTVDQKDDAIEDLCRKNSVSSFRGSEVNVLDRCIKASKTFGLNTVIRIGADCPFIDPEIINDMLKIYQQELSNGNRLDYLSNNLNRSFPIGLDAEIFDANVFIRIDEETKHLPEEERKSNELNVVPYLHQNIEQFNSYSYKKDYDLSHHRWTLDTPEDFDLIEKIYEVIYPIKPLFIMNDILEVLSKNPDWSLINSKIVPVTGFWTEAEREKLSKRLKETGKA